MNAPYRPYDCTIDFRNEDVTYGTETYRVMAINEDQAKRKALQNATGSQYDDDRIPDRKLIVTECDLVDLDEMA